MHNRFGEVIHDGAPFSELRFHPERLEVPLHWRDPRTVFLGSMTDMFHGDVLLAWWDIVLGIIAATPQHRYVVLTKRPHSFARVFRRETPKNLWLGVSVENSSVADARLTRLLDMWNHTRAFVSVEPILGPVHLGPWIGDLAGVIAGAETGPRARPAELDWFRSLRDECAEADVPFFLKQVNARRERVLDGRTHDDLPWPVRPARAETARRMPADKA